MSFVLDDLILEYERETIKIYDLLVEIGGFVTTLKIFGYILICNYQSSLKFTSIIEKLFKVEEIDHSSQ